MSRLGLIALCTTAWLAIGCAEVQVGTLRGLPVRLGPLGPSAGATLVVSTPVDRRPEVERTGDAVRMRTFLTIGVVTHWSRRGNYVTDEQASTPNAAAELQAGAIEALRAARVARWVGVSGQADFTLQTDIVHLYATHFGASQGTVFVAGSRRASTTGVFAGSRNFASYGNVVIGARLIDHRGPAPFTVWQEQVSGFGQEPPAEDELGAAQAAIREAASDALATLAVRVAAALDRLRVGPSGPSYELSGQLPAVFLIERVSRYRNFVERVYIETDTARVLRHEIEPLADPAFARPGDWLLSRKTAEGITLSPSSYLAYSRTLASKYDLRTVDDVQRLHFFGARN